MTPWTLMSNWRWATLSGSSTKGPMGMIPALLTSTSSGPCAASAASRKAAKESRSVTSRTSAWAPRRAAVASTAAASTSPRVTRAPSRRNRAAVASPIPRAPPVMATCRPPSPSALAWS